MFEKISHIMLYATDLDRAIYWYREKLGFEVDYHAPGAYASLSHETLGRLALHASSSDKHIGVGPQLYFECVDIEKALGSLVAVGVRVGSIMLEGESPRFADFWDSEGNTLGIEER